MIINIYTVRYTVCTRQKYSCNPYGDGGKEGGVRRITVFSLSHEDNTPTRM